jgi:endonuclease/exonuclease/phosphatase family metal-dependent hydrolase
LAGPINQERGFVGVDATVNGKSYRFVNTHLELQFPAPDPNAPFIQAAQASQLIASANFLPPPAAGSEVLIVGDINSSPTDPTFTVPLLGPTVLRPPYMQLANNTDLFGGPLGAAPNTDVWNLRPGNSEGFTCCQLADLSNPTSNHDERIDVIFSKSIPTKVKANVLDDEPSDKTSSRLWPSDHSAVTSELSY